MIRSKDGATLLLLALMSFALFAGKVFFWGDLTFLHHPWRALAGEMLQRGALPLWNPYAYLGMPLAAGMQSAVWYPGTIPFYLLSFEAALFTHNFIHFFLAGALTFLWLRRRGFSRTAALGGASLYMLGGNMICRIPFLNHAATLALFPALLLAGNSAFLFSLGASLSFLAGYPPMTLGAVLASLPSLRIKKWAAAGALSLGFSACLLIPAAELALQSRRSVPISEEESLRWSYSPGDLLRFVAPLEAPEEYPAARNWYKTSHIGFLGCAAAGLGLMSFPAAAAPLAAVLALILGASNPFSRWLWLHLTPLQFLRYPGNLAFLAAPVLAFLAAAGIKRLRRYASLAALGIAAELFLRAAGSSPLADGGYFTDAGPLVRLMQRDLNPHRYLMSPLALNWTRGADALFRHRLYGIGNSPFHLSAVSNFGEPLVPRASYAFMDFLLSRSGLPALAPWLAAADAKWVLTRDALAPRPLRYLGDSLWHVYDAGPSASRAYWLEESARIPADLSDPPPDFSRTPPLAVLRAREDRFSISGNFSRPGWVYLAEPRFPGWRGPATEPALLAFQKFRVPAGPWDVSFRYDPASWRLGRAATILFLWGTAAYWYNRFRRKFTP